MRIAVCDDELYFREVLKSAVYKYSNKYRLEIVIDEFAYGEDLLISKNNYDIVLLDYKMDGVDGLSVARALRKRYLNCTIIFITSYPQIVYESFEVGTFRFLKKPLDIQKLYKAFDDFFKKIGDNYPLTIRVNGEIICIKTNDIVFLEADNKKCFIHLIDKKLHFAKTMATIERLVPKNIFYKVNRAFIVNFNYIKRYDSDSIYLKNNCSVHVSRNYLASFKVAYCSYVKDHSA